MKFCAIVPPGCEHLLPEDQATLCFANIAFEDDNYRLAYGRRASWIVLDNEIYEKKPPLDPVLFANVVELIRPDVCIIPDVRGDVDKTLQYAKWYMKYLRFLDNSKIGLYGVIQGIDEDSIRRCAEYWMSEPVQGVAVPMRVDGRTLSRIDVYTQLVRPMLPSHFKVHLLGVEAWPYDDEVTLARFPEIVSCDTAEPTSAAYRGINLTHEEAKEAVARPSGFMTSQAIKDQLELNKELLHTNFQRLQEKFN